MFDRLRLCSVPVYRGVWPQRWLKVQINVSYDVNARQCSSATCKEDIFPNNKSIRAVLCINNSHDTVCDTKRKIGCLPHIKQLK